MAQPLHEPGMMVDGFRLEQLVHQGGMAMLWHVTRPDLAGPVLMKVPRIGEGADPAAIVSFEMEQMIAPRLSGVHVPKFIAGGDFAAQPYLAMERIDGTTLLPHTQAKRILDRLKRLAHGRDLPDAAACARFDTQTRNGEDMQAAQQLLAAAVASIVGKSEERAVASLFTPGGTHALRGEFAGSGDFEVVAWLAVLPEADAWRQ